MTDNRTTELLCKLLDERGVSCQTHYLHASWCVGPKLYDAVDNLDGTLTVSNLTPEQAIAATLGGGECECVWNEQEGTFRCSSCDTLLTNEISIEWPSHKVTPITLPNYCRNCGKAVKR